MSTVELLELHFKDLMARSIKGGIGLIDLTDKQVRSVISSMKTGGVIVTAEEVRLCFKSFRRQWYKDHVTAPRIPKAMKEAMA